MRGNKRYIMFHGTSHVSADSIEKYGFRPSIDGMLGSGVYVSSSVKKAVNYGPVVLMLDVEIGKLITIDRQNHPRQKNWANLGYEAAFVPPDCGMVPSGLSEN